MSRTVITKLLQAVPPQDLKGLKSICIRTVPHKATKKRCRRWGGLHGQFNGHGDEGTGRVWVYLWSITKRVFREFRYGNSNLYDSFMERFAATLYHEIGHHVHSKTEEFKRLEAKMKRLNAKMRRIKKTTTITCNGEKFIVFTNEYQNLRNEKAIIEEEIEKPAKEYAERMLAKAREMSLLQPPHPTGIRFFNIMRDRMISDWMTRYEENKREKERVAWAGMHALFDHLRKCKLGNGVKYNLREIFVKIYADYPEKNELRRFKRFVLKHVKPFYYVSRSGRKYGYFTEAQMNELRRCKDGFERTPKPKPEPLRAAIINSEMV